MKKRKKNKKNLAPPSHLAIKGRVPGGPVMPKCSPPMSDMVSIIPGRPPSELARKKKKKKKR
jgi:hypothetical protein